MTHTSHNPGSSALAFLIGISAGVAAGLLLAPRSGSETRGKLREKAEQARSKMAEQASKEKDMIQDVTDQAVTKVTGKTEDALEAGRRNAAGLEQKTRRASNRLADEE